MNRLAYQAQRQARPSREDRGLPHHPAADGFATCLDCDGRGEYVKSSLPWANTYTCPTCDGFGVVPDGRGPDPLLVMRTDRKWIRHSATRRRYMAMRAAAVKPCHRLPLAEARAYSAIQERRMLAAAQGCVDAFNALGVAA